MRKIIIDTDTASDDATAIVLALRTKDLHVEAITTVAGNVPIEMATHNALVAVNAAGTYHPPVYQGCGAPLCRPLMTAGGIHGEDGLGNNWFPRPDIPVEAEHAADAIARIIRDNDDVEIVTLGPLTNIAMAIRMYPDIMKKVKHITSMGGQYRVMNPHLPASEFNVAVDAEATQIVLESGAFVEFIPLDVCLGECAFQQEDIDRLLAVGTPAAEFLVQCNKALAEYCARDWGAYMITMPDPTAMAYFLDPTLATGRFEAYTQCETKSPITFGQLVYDYNGLLGKEPNAALITEMDGKRFKQLVIDCCKPL